MTNPLYGANPVNAAIPQDTYEGKGEWGGGRGGAYLCLTLTHLFFFSFYLTYSLCSRSWVLGRAPGNGAVKELVHVFFFFLFVFFLLTFFFFLFFFLFSVLSLSLSLSLSRAILRACFVGSCVTIVVMG